ncbi:DUF6794 domain-containing protein [Psychroserpens burtonensis]|uniref:DUF6794 domain-containing protein n=1 Tax=Psychroserpens burtonensis TaxID=49278 RepID=UPI0004149AC4|nr:DUF6794 domain-containing protein [Psychroserpens burtonensis]
MRNTITIILLLVFGTVFSQDDCKDYKENYIPKNLKDAIEYLNCELSESDKTEFKNKEEDDAVTELHFGTGMGIRNGWELWKGKNQISRFFNSKGISHPDDISSIILTSFHRELNNKPIDLDSQIKYYKSYWENSRKELEEKEQNQIELSKKEFDNFEINESVKIEFEINKQGKNVWAYRIQKYPNLNEEPNCYIKGTIIKKKKKTRKRGKYILTILLSDICGNEKAIFNGEEDGLNINQEYDFSLMNFKISKN